MWQFPVKSGVRKCHDGLGLAFAVRAKCYIIVGKIMGFDNSMTSIVHS